MDSDSANAGRPRGNDRGGSADSMVAFQEYLDTKFSSLKRESRDDLLVSNDKQFKKLKKSSCARDFKWTSNRKQFEFNSGLIEQLESVSSFIQNKEQRRSLDRVAGIVKSLTHRNKLIKYADKIPAAGIRLLNMSRMKSPAIATMIKRSVVLKSELWQRKYFVRVQNLQHPQSVFWSRHVIRVMLMTLLGVSSILFVLFDETTSNSSNITPAVVLDTFGRTAQDYANPKESDIIPFLEAPSL